MTHVDALMLKLAQKLLETFADRSLRGFERYWALSGPVETFAASATGIDEEELAKALQIALEAALMRTAPDSVHPDALAMVEAHGLKRAPQRQWKPLGSMKRRS